MNLLRFLQIILPGIFLLFLGFFGLAWSNENYSERLMKARERERLERIEYLAQRDKPLVFHGKVVDLKGNPVPEAKVIMELSYTPPTTMLTGRKVFEKITDEAGRFKVEGTGYLLSLSEIIKPGYQYHFKYNQTRGFRFQKGKKRTELGEVDDHPVVFKVRKKGTPTLVLTGGGSFQMRPGPNSIQVVDLQENRWSEPEKIK